VKYLAYPKMDSQLRDSSGITPASFKINMKKNAIKITVHEASGQNICNYQCIYLSNELKKMPNEMMRVKYI